MKTQLVENGNCLLVVIGQEPFDCSDIHASILFVYDLDWNRDLSPWFAPKVFPKGEDFAGNGDETIRKILALPVLQDTRWQRKCIVGYSLAGLFCLYCCTKTDCFDGCASVSGSLWYPGWLTYLQDHVVNCKTVYLSLGDKEHLTKNPLMKTVLDCTLETQKIVGATFESNPGNHFFEDEKRLKKAMLYLLKESFN